CELGVDSTLEGSVVGPSLCVDCDPNCLLVRFHSNLLTLFSGLRAALIAFRSSSRAASILLRSLSRDRSFEYASSLTSHVIQMWPHLRHWRCRLMAWPLSRL